MMEVLGLDMKHRVHVLMRWMVVVLRLSHLCVYEIWVLIDLVQHHLCDMDEVDLCK